MIKVKVRIPESIMSVISTKEVNKYVCVCVCETK